MSNNFCHMELNSNNPEKAKEFFSKLFDWEYEDYKMEDGVYIGIKTKKEPGGGIFNYPIPNVPSHWLAYVEVDDIEAYTAKVKELGGVILKDITEVPEMGKFSVFQDPTGAVLAMWQCLEKK